MAPAVGPKPRKLLTCSTRDAHFKTPRPTNARVTTFGEDEFVGLTDADASAADAVALFTSWA